MVLWERAAVNVLPANCAIMVLRNIWQGGNRYIMTAISVTKIFKFDAAHFLPEHSGKCADLHGHTYRLEVTVARFR